MKKTIILLSMLLCLSTALANETNSAVIQVGDKIGNHLKRLESYPRTDQTRKMPFGPSGNITARWNIGNGTLHITHSVGVGIITSMKFGVSSDGKNEVTFVVEEFNPTTGELTMILPNNLVDPISESAPKGAAPEKGHK
jgi:hypothetical protein